MVIELRAKTLWYECMRTWGFSILSYALVLPILIFGFTLSALCRTPEWPGGKLYCGVQMPNFVDLYIVDSLLIGGIFLLVFVISLLARASMYPWIRFRDLLMSRKNASLRIFIFAAIALGASVLTFATTPMELRGLLFLSPLAVTLYAGGEALLSRRLNNNINTQTRMEEFIYSLNNKNYPYGRPRMIIIPILLWLVIVVIPLALFLLLHDPWWIYKLFGRRSDLIEGSIGLVIMMVVPILLFFLAIISYSLFRPDAAQFLDKSDSEVVPLLRGFADDARVFGTSKRIVSENDLRELVSTQGAFVAIGDPKEALPRIGALRTYALDESWQQIFASLIDRSRIICIIAGASSWLAWEIDQLRIRGALRRAIVCFPKRSSADEAETIKKFEESSGISIRGITDGKKKVLFVTFDKAGSQIAIVAGVQSKSAYALGGRLALLAQHLELDPQQRILV